LSTAIVSNPTSPQTRRYTTLLILAFINSQYFTR